MYIHWTRPAQIQVCADQDFREEENPNSIVWAVWDAILDDELDVDESGTIPIAEGVCMIKCDTTVVFCEDGVGRPCFVVWIQEESSGSLRWPSSSTNQVCDVGLRYQIPRRLNSRTVDFLNPARRPQLEILMHHPLM